METLATVRHRAPQPSFEVHGGDVAELLARPRDARLGVPHVASADRVV